MTPNFRLAAARAKRQTVSMRPFHPYRVKVGASAGQGQDLPNLGNRINIIINGQKVGAGRRFVKILLS